MTLREQLMLKRNLRRLRTWAPPISMGVIIGAGMFLIAERLEPARAAQPEVTAERAQQTQHPQRAASPQRQARPTLVSQPSRAYSDCDAARAAGAAPLRAGEPGFGPHLDADRDGVACEPYSR